MYEAMLVYHTEYYENLEKGLPPPQASDYIGKCLYQIARNYAKKPNFSGYLHKEEMIADAVLNCMIYLHKFDPTRFKNPFSYFTQVIHNAFLRRIEQEKTHLYIRMKQAFYAQIDPKSLPAEHNEISQDFIKKFEQKKLSKKAKSTKMTVITKNFK